MKDKYKPFKVITVAVTMIMTCAPSMHITTKGGVPIKYCNLPIPFAISEDTPKKLKDHIRRGVLYWNGILNRKLLIDFGDTGYTLESPFAAGFLMIGVVSKLSRQDINRSGRTTLCGSAFLRFSVDGCIKRSKIRINLAHTNDINILETIIRHEVGHVLGLKDSMDFTALMSRTIEDTMQHPVSANDKEITAIKKLYNLEIK